MPDASLFGFHPALEAAAFAAFLWWFSTGVILLLDGLPPRTFRWSLTGATLLSLAALGGLAVSARDTSPAGAYAAFACALGIWAWFELSFLTGVLTGPRRIAAAPDARGFTRFAQAVGAIAYHELAIAGSVLVVFALTAGQPNAAGLWTYLALWVMRTSAKLNLFFGVRNLSEEFLPAHLAYLQSFFRRRAVNLLFPLSVTGASLALALMVAHALDAATSPAAAIGTALVGTMLALAIVEHWMLVLPLDTTALWRWAIREAGRRREPPLRPLSPTAEVVPLPIESDDKLLRAR
jgi:putative photosynthetic complex assembly protein 2